MRKRELLLLSDPSFVMRTHRGRRERRQQHLPLPEMIGNSESDIAEDYGEHLPILDLPNPRLIANKTGKRRRRRMERNDDDYGIHLPLSLY